MEIKGVIWHHSGGTAYNPLQSTFHHTAEIIDLSHKTRWPGFVSDTHTNGAGQPFHVGYNFVIESGRKNIVRTRRIGEETAAAIGYNKGWVHVCVTGNYDSDLWDTDVSPLVYKVWQKIKAEQPHLKISDNIVHRDVASKTCPGRNLPDDHFRNIIARYETMNGKDFQEAIDEKEIERKKHLILQLQKAIHTLRELLTQRRMK